MKVTGKYQESTGKAREITKKWLGKLQEITGNADQESANKVSGKNFKNTGTVRGK